MRHKGAIIRYCDQQSRSYDSELASSPSSRLLREPRKRGNAREGANWERRRGEEERDSMRPFWSRSVYRAFNFECEWKGITRKLPLSLPPSNPLFSLLLSTFRHPLDRLYPFTRLIRWLVINSRITRPWRWNFRGSKSTQGPRVYNYEERRRMARREIEEHFKVHRCVHSDEWWKGNVGIDKRSESELPIMLRAGEISCSIPRRLESFTILQVAPYGADGYPRGVFQSLTTCSFVSSRIRTKTTTKINR